jgi:hypothetical protein
MVLTTRNLFVYPYSDYQTELHDIIQNLHDEGLGYRKIARWLNDNEYQTPRGKRFFNSHVHSILASRTCGGKYRKYEKVSEMKKTLTIGIPLTLFFDTCI